MFYLSGTAFFVSCDVLIVIGIVLEWHKHKKTEACKILKAEIMALLARVQNEEARKKATEFFNGAKNNIVLLQRVKARLIEIQLGAPNV